MSMAAELRQCERHRFLQDCSPPEGRGGVERSRFGSAAAVGYARREVPMTLISFRSVVFRSCRSMYYHARSMVDWGMCTKAPYFIA